MTEHEFEVNCYNERIKFLIAKTNACLDNYVILDRKVLIEKKDFTIPLFDHATMDLQILKIMAQASILIHDFLEDHTK